MNLSLITELNESRQFRTKHMFSAFNARIICDMAFLDICSLWILHNEFETSPWAIEYAGKTAMRRNFKQYSQMATDTYHALHVVEAIRTDLLKSDADNALLNKTHFNTQQVVRYLTDIAQNRVNPRASQQTLQRLEQSLHIQDSNYRSIRRLVQNWSNITTAQKRMVMTRLNFFYMTHARRSDIAQKIRALGLNGNLIDKDANNPELLKKLAIYTASGVAGYALGQAIGNALT